MKKTKVSERSERLEKLKELRRNKINPYPAKSNRIFRVKDILQKFNEFQTAKKSIYAAGRLMSKREHGNLIFSQIKDASGKIQIAFSKKEIGVDKFKIFKKLIDVGDFLEVKGGCFVTHKGEKSIKADDFKILSKAIRPLPEKWHGLKDEEEKLRKRYLDIIFNDEIRDMIEKKAVFWNSAREFMNNNGFLEVETPVLEVTAGGADARPFTTHHNALDLDVYLRISMGELWQKRLMVAGLEKTFEIGRQFRNEGMSSEHMQDYTQMEFYWAYADYRDGMKLVEKLFKYIAEKTFGTLKFNIRGHKIDLGKKWEIYDFQKIIKENTGLDVLSASKEQIEKKLKELKIDYNKKGFNLTRAIDNLWKYCRKNIAGPGFLINVPVTMEPLAKRSEENPDIVERFQVMLAGSELGKGYSELNDPIDQAERFKSQQKLREAGDDEAQMHDHDFVEALEYGMPPTCGFGMSERLFSFLMDKSTRECQIFPLMKPKN
ncbi:lysine--tRNA ligase [Candidatus Falkowbacteria bacterium]|nr:MAG: lysine--tRNA ligase [Candidatus Falkowbacteria bacterium]